MVLGVDVGGTKIAVAAVKDMAAVYGVEHPTVTESTEALLDGLEAAVHEVIRHAGQPEAIGVGVPSQIEYATGTVETSVNIPLTGVPLREELGRRFGVPVFVDNDANCAALAEAHILGENDLVMLTPLHAQPGRSALPGELSQSRLHRGLLLGAGARTRRDRAGSGQAGQPALPGARSRWEGQRT